jgi:predicted MFS family arabinose efflux permease
MTGDRHVATSLLVRLTTAKAVANTALRWIPPFLPTLERAFGASTTQLTTVLGLGETAGLSTIAVGRHLDRRRERSVMVAGLSLVSMSAVLSLVGSLAAFAVAFVILIIGVANFTVAGHAWISHRVDYRWRARSIGLFETSWALSLLVGAPIIAVLISAFGWRAPFAAIAVAAAGAAVTVALTMPAEAPGELVTTTDASTAVSLGRPDDEPAAGAGSGLPARAWLLIAGAALMAMSGLSVFVISGTWLEDDFGLSTGGLGVVAMGIGGAELLGSTGTATFADRLGKLRSTLGGLVALVGGVGTMLLADGRLAVGVVGLLLLLLGFEFGIVTTFSLVSEAAPDARGRTLAVGNAIGTVARGGGTLLSGWLYAAHGFAGTGVLSLTAAAAAAGCLLLSTRHRSDRT